MINHHRIIAVSPELVLPSVAKCECLQEYLATVLVSQDRLLRRESGVIEMSTSNAKQRKSRKVDFVLCLQLPSGKNVCSRLAHMKRCVLPSSQSNLAVKTRCLCYSPRKELSLLLCHRSPQARKRTNGYQKMV